MPLDPKFDTSGLSKHKIVMAELLMEHNKEISRIMVQTIITAVSETWPLDKSIRISDLLYYLKKLKGRI